MPRRTFIAIFLSAEFCLSTAASSAEPDNLGRRVLAREVIEETGREVTVYEIVTPGASPTALPPAVRVTRHTVDAASHRHEDAIGDYCREERDSSSEATESCIRRHMAAFHRITEESEALRSDAGLANIITGCMSQSKVEEGYDWLAVELCYERGRKLFMQLYGR